MANQVDCASLYFLPGRFGPATVSIKDLPGGILGAAHHNVASVPSYLRVGVVCAAPLSSGWAEFVYLKFTAAAGPTPAAKHVCIPQTAATGLWIFTNDPDESSGLTTEGNPLGAVMISAMTSGRYGWFLTGGSTELAQELVAALDGAWETDGNLVEGPFGTHDAAADQIGIGPCAAAEMPIGYTLANDN